jgi:hypothetical protein
MKAQFADTNGLEYTFNPAATLTVLIRNRWVETDPYFFRSWGGQRQVNGKTYEGPVYNLGSNLIEAPVTQTAKHIAQ